MSLWLCLFVGSAGVEAGRSRVRAKPRLRVDPQTRVRSDANVRVPATGTGAATTRTRPGAEPAARPQNNGQGGGGTNAGAQGGGGQPRQVFGTEAGGGGARTTVAPARLWEITPAGTAVTRNHKRFGNFHKSKSDGTWWSRDIDQHGNSIWKVFREDKKGLHWIADADEYGQYITNKHKGATGRFIPWGQFGKPR